MEVWLFSCLPFRDLLCSNKPRKPEMKTTTFASTAPESFDFEPSAVCRRINDEAELRRLLEMLDDGGNGRILLSRLLRPMQEVEDEENWTMSVEEVVAVATGADSGQCMGSLVSAFEFYDRDGDGFISAGDLEVALPEVMEEVGGVGGKASSVGKWEEMVKAYDKEQVGGVCFDDFVRMMSSRWNQSLAK